VVPHFSLLDPGQFNFRGDADIGGLRAPPSPAGPVIFNSDGWPLATAETGIIPGAIALEDGSWSTKHHRSIVTDVGRIGEGMLVAMRKRDTAGG
jgi:hypothetical protein